MSEEKWERLQQRIQQVLLKYMSAIHAELIHSHDDVFLAQKIIEICREEGLEYATIKLNKKGS